MSVGQKPSWNLYQTSWKLNFSTLETILENLETILGNLSRSSVCDVKRQAGAQHMCGQLPCPIAEHPINIARQKIKNEGPNMLKYFATPLWAIHTTRGVQDVLKWVPKVHKRPPDILHVACKRGCAVGAHDHATACQMFAAFAIMGHGFLLV